MPAGPRKNMRLVASLPRPEGFSFRSEAAGRPARRHRRRRRRQSRRPASRRQNNPQATAVRLRSRQCAGLFELGHCLPGASARSSGTSTRLQHLRHRGTRGAETARLGRVPRRTGRRLGVRTPALLRRSSRRADAIDCGTQGVQDAGQRRAASAASASSTSATSSKPQQVAAVQTCRGSHTHTLVTAKSDTAEHLRLRVRHRHGARGRRARRLLGPRSEGRSEHGALQHRRHPGAARRAREGARSSTVRGSSRDAKTGDIAGLCGPAAITAPARRRRRSTNQCHDITVFPEVGLAAGACSGNGILLDISDPVHPGAARRTWRTRTSPTGTRRRSTTTARRCSSPTSGAAARVRAAARPICPNWGADAIFDIVDQQAEVRRATTRCRRRRPTPRTASRTTASLIPVPGRDIMVQAWYQGGVSVFDFTDSAHPVEIAFFDRGPLDAKQPDHRRLLVDLLVQLAASTAPRSRAASTSSG